LQPPCQRWPGFLAPEAEADPKLRYQIDQRGDMILLGNTVGFDCRPGIPKPIVGTVDVVKLRYQRRGLLGGRLVA
jgi:hypothetical protein